jgi:hypothetical protein
MSRNISISILISTGREALQIWFVRREGKKEKTVKKDACLSQHRQTPKRQSLVRKRHCALLVCKVYARPGSHTAGPGHSWSPPHGTDNAIHGFIPHGAPARRPHLVFLLTCFKHLFYLPTLLHSMTHKQLHKSIR